jgi:two-component system, NarL family, sensor histidine kinase DevS
MADSRDRKDMLLEAGLTLAAELSLPMVLQRIVDLAAEVTDARYVALGVIGDDGKLVDFITTGISAKQRQAIGSLPQGRGLLGLLIREPRIVRIDDIRKHSDSVGFPPNHPPMRSFLGAPVQAMGRIYGNIYLTEKRGAQEFSPEDELSVVILATQAGVAIANASLYRESLRRERWLEALREITGAILEGAEASSLLISIAEHARALAEADAATILTTTPRAGLLEVAAAVGAHAKAVQGQSVPAAKSISGEVIETGKVLHTDDASTHAHAYQPIIRLGNVGPAIFVPLRVRGRATGTLMVANLKGGKPFDLGTVRLTETFADQASVAIEYGRAQAELQRLGLMDERERIAKELHDGIIQSLFAVGMSLQSTALTAAAPQTASRIESAVEELDKVIRDLRNYIFGLRPGILADRQLDQALRVLGEEFHASSKIPIDVEVEAALAANLSSRSHEIVQLTREALSNAARHAHAGHAVVRLTRKGGAAVLTIEDDGVGFDVSASSEGSGLRNMHERAKAMGATLRVTSRARKGARLVVTFPAATMSGSGGAATRVRR